jgi:hypothetical protein
MVLIYSRMPSDPRIERLNDRDHLAWVTIVTACSKRRSEVLSVDDIFETFGLLADWTPSEVARMLTELAASELVRTLDDGAVFVLARGDLWQFEDEGAE